MHVAITGYGCQSQPADELENSGGGNGNIQCCGDNITGSGTVVFRREILRDAEGDSTVKSAFIGIAADVAGAAREIEKLRASGQ